MKKPETKPKSSFKTHVILLILAYISFIIYLVFEIKNITNINDNISEILGLLFIFILLISFTIMKSKNKKNSSGFINIGSILIIGYCIINILLVTKVINLPKDEFIPNFYNQSILEVDKWKKKNNITINELYEYSDTIKKDYIVSQNLTAPTLTKDIKEITITISLGPDLEKEVIVPNFIGLKYEDVLKYIENNHLSNVKIEYVKSEKQEDTVISQSKSGTLKRNSEIIITFAKSSDELGDIAVIDLTNKTKLYAISWLEKYGFKVETKEEYNDTILDGYVINQSIKDETIDPKENTIILTISKGKRVIAPDLTQMSPEEINKWAVENLIKISYKEEYNDEVKLGKVISSSVNKDDLIDREKTVIITISKGKLEMIKITSISEFTNWAETNNVKYGINYENSDTVKKDDIIKTSHKTGEVIKNSDTVVITISRGKVISIPNFVGMTKANISSKCSSINLSCSFKYGGYSETVKKDVATSQSKASGTKVSEGTGITITLSSGIQEKVNVPSFIGKTKSQITSSCNSIGVKCTFKEVYSAKTSGTCTKQSVTGKVNKGSTVTITLSKGACRIAIQPGWLSWGNPQATKTSLEKRLKDNCPGITFKFSFVKPDSNTGVGIGYLSETSDIQANKVYDFVQDKVYNVKIISN